MQSCRLHSDNVSYTSCLERYREVLSVLASFLVRGRSSTLSACACCGCKDCSAVDGMVDFAMYMVIERYAACGQDQNGDPFVMEMWTAADRLSRVVCYLACCREEHAQQLGSDAARSAAAAMVSSSGASMRSALAGAAQDVQIALFDGIAAAVQCRRCRRRDEVRLWPRPALGWQWRGHACSRRWSGRRWGVADGAECGAAMPCSTCAAGVTQHAGAGVAR